MPPLVLPPVGGDGYGEWPFTISYYKLSTV